MSSQPSSRTQLPEALLIVGVALALRLALLFAFDTPAGVEGKTPWTWACEPACMADAWVRGDGLADPFGRGTGPSAWLTPVYPGLIAAAMALGGGLTPAAAAGVYVVQALASAWTALLLLALGRRLANPLVGRIAGWGWALHPTASWYAIQQVWDTTLVAAGLTALVWLLVVSGRGPRPGRAAAIGAAYGALLMINPAPAGVLPAVLWYLVPGGGLAPAARRTLAFAGGALLVCGPWMARNLDVVGTPGLRSNLGVELRVGNNDDADGWHRKDRHPGWTDAETARMVKLGERDYATECGDEAKSWIRDNPGRFVELTLARLRLLWFGVEPTADERSAGGVAAANDPKSWIRWGMHLLVGTAGLVGLGGFARRRPDGTLVRLIVLLFGLPYYATHVLERYRFPIDPLLVLAGAWAAASLLQWRVARGRPSP